MTTIIQILTAGIWITISWLLPRPRSGFGLGWSGCVPITITTLIRRSPIIVRRDDDDYKAGVWLGKRQSTTGMRPPFNEYDG